MRESTRSRTYLRLAPLLIAAVYLLVPAGPAAARSADLYAPAGAALPAAVREAPPRRPAAAAEPVAVLASAARGAGERLAAIRAWNRDGRRPARVGLARPLETAPRVRLVPETSGAASFSTAGSRPAGGSAGWLADGSRVWEGEVRVDGAHRLRLRLTDLRLPPDARLWVSGASGAAVGPFAPDAAHGGALWTPSVAGPVIRLLVRLPPVDAGDDPGFRIDRVGEILHPAVAFPGLATAAAALDASCLLDVQCLPPDSDTFPAVSDVERAVAHLQFPMGDGFGACTGALLNDGTSSGTPYLLTAGRCIPDQAAASGLEAFWNLRTDECGDELPAVVPQTNGATLLATGTGSDFSLLRLDGLPPQPVFLGWNADPEVLQDGAVLHRVHHPMPEGTLFGQSYSRLQHLASGFNQCGTDAAGRDLDDPDLFHHGRILTGGTFGGSTGAPLMLGDGTVVGQLSARCGPDPEEGCDDRNQEVDGAFSASFPALEPFLGPAGPSCVPNATTLCLNRGRFRARMSWRTPQGADGQGLAVNVVPRPDSSGLFYFLNPDNWEMLLKVLDGCPVNGHYWVFFAATTNVGFTLTVTDTLSGEEREFVNPVGRRADAVTETQAFATCP